MKGIGIGTEFFHNLIEANCFYVDKTPFIKTVFAENKADVMLITRLRRFGKTLTLTTFWDFLSLDPQNPGDVTRQKKWFKGTKILKSKKFCSEYMGKFPVIFITLKEVDGETFLKAYQQLGSAIYTALKHFKYLSESTKLDEDEINNFKELFNEKFLCNPDNQNAVKNSLERLIYWLATHHGVKPIVLIDEYDIPIAKAAHKGYYREMIDIISPFLGNALKTNPYLGRAVLTGCLRAAKESIFTGLNNFLICTVLDLGDDDLSTGIGFTEQEADKVLTYFGLEGYKETARRHYDGYWFGTNRMYCPWDIMSFCKGNHKIVGQKNKQIYAANYWLNTSGNDYIEEFMGFIEPEDVNRMQDLLDGKTITTEIRPSLCYGDLQKHNIADFWALLLYSGYLTFDPESFSPEKESYRLYIPNEEIRKCFRDKILDYYKNNSTIQNCTSNLIKGFFEGNTPAVEDSLNELLAKYVSIRDFSVNAPKENYYHGFINGPLANGTALIKEQKSNFESGNGYVDLIIKAQNSKSENRGIIVILELKQTPDENEDKFLIAEDAVEQIIKKKYADQYIKRNDIQSVISYGICFCKKECSVVMKILKKNPA